MRVQIISWSPKSRSPKCGSIRPFDKVQIFGCDFAAYSMNGKYTVELCRPGGEDTGIERVFERQDDLAIAHKLYRTIAAEYPGRVVMLCDRARVLARSDRLAMPD